MDTGRDDERQATEKYAFQALEERHAILSEAHRIMATEYRSQHLRSNGGSPEELQQILEKRAQLSEELRQSLLEASEAAWADREAMTAVLSIPEFQRDCAIAGRVLVAWPGAWELVDSSVFADRSLMLKVISQHGWWLRYASRQLQEDKEVVMAAVVSDALALRFASAELQADKAVVLAAASARPEGDWPFSRNGFLRFASAELQNDKEVVLAAVAHGAMNIAYAGRALKGDRDVALAALRCGNRDGQAVLEELSQELRSDRELVLEAIGSKWMDGGTFHRVISPGAIQAASLELKADQDFILRAMRRAEGRRDVFDSLLEDRQPCDLDIFRKAAEMVRRTKSYQEFHDAASSCLGIRGEHSPVVTVTLGTGNDGQQGRAESSFTERPSFEARLLSGVSFQCSFLPDDDDGSFFGGPAIGYHSWGRLYAAQPLKRPRRGSSEGQSVTPTTGSTWSDRTVDQLAALVLEELPNHVEVDPFLDSVFLIISKPGDGEDVALTPWDWARPVADFL